MKTEFKMQKEMGTYVCVSMDKRSMCCESLHLYIHTYIYIHKYVYISYFEHYLCPIELYQTKIILLLYFITENLKTKGTVKILFS